jgi:hypothetical protein
MAKKTEVKTEPKEEVVVSQGIYKADSDNLKLIGQLNGDASIAATIKRVLRPAILSAMMTGFANSE